MEDKETIFKAGQTAQEMYIISSGYVECYNEKDMLQLTFKRGALFGEFALLGVLTQRCYTCKCKGPVELLTILGEKFEEEFEAEKKMMRQFEQQAGATLGMLANRFDFATSWQRSEPFFRALLDDKAQRANAFFKKKMGAKLGRFRKKNGGAAGGSKLASALASKPAAAAAAAPATPATAATAATTTTRAPSPEAFKEKALTHDDELQNTSAPKDEAAEDAPKQFSLLYGSRSTQIAVANAANKVAAPERAARKAAKEAAGKGGLYAGALQVRVDANGELLQEMKQLMLHTGRRLEAVATMVKDLQGNEENPYSMLMKGSKKPKADNGS